MFDNICNAALVALVAAGHIVIAVALLQPTFPERHVKSSPRAEQPSPRLAKADLPRGLTLAPHADAR